MPLVLGRLRGVPLENRLNGSVYILFRCVAAGEDAWSRLNHRERSFAICEELRRLVVRAKQSGSKGYRWEIVSDDSEAIVRQATAWYNSMAQAYDCGAAALAAFSASSVS
jgi:hypothetical protein